MLFHLPPLSASRQANHLEKHSLVWPLLTLSATDSISIDDSAANLPETALLRLKIQFFLSPIVGSHGQALCIRAF